MQSAFDELGIELLKWGFRKVVFLEVECKIDGTHRIGVSAGLPIGDQFECPKCHAQRPCSGIIATGYSRQPLPFHEFWNRSGRWDDISADEYRPPVPKPGLGGRARHYQKALQVCATEESAKVFATA
jgi:hypothetical protein